MAFDDSAGGLGALRQRPIGGLIDPMMNQGRAIGGIDYAPPTPEVGIIERAASVAVSLQALHDKLGTVRDKIEGNGQVSGKNSQKLPVGLRGQLSEAESVLRACHSLLDDIAGKF